MASWRRKDNESLDEDYARNFEPAHFNRKPISVLIEDIPEEGEELSLIVRNIQEEECTTPALQLKGKEEEEEEEEEEEDEEGEEPVSYSDVGADGMDQNELEEFMRRERARKKMEDDESIREAVRTQQISGLFEENLSDEEEIRNEEDERAERRREKSELPEPGVRTKKKEKLNTRAAKRADQKRKRDAKRTGPQINEIKETVLATIGKIHPLSEKACAILRTHNPVYLSKLRITIEEYCKWWKGGSRPSFVVSHSDTSACEFFKTVERKYAPNTLWSKFSYLKKFLFAQFSIDLKASLSYPITTALLKKINEGYEPISAKEFTTRGKERIQRYWAQCNNELQKLDSATLLRITGSLGATFAADRSAEIHCLKVKEMKILNKYEVEITSTRVKSNPFAQAHLIASNFEYAAGDLFEELVKRTYGPDPDPEAYLFVQVNGKSGEFEINKPCAPKFWTTIARDIAEFLGYPEEDIMEFSSHSFRSTSASSMAENGAGTSRICNHGNWANPKTVNDRYVRRTSYLRRQNAAFILGKSHVRRTEESAKEFEQLSKEEDEKEDEEETEESGQKRLRRERVAQYMEKERKRIRLTFDSAVNLVFEAD
jgi:hypothetical protein